MTQEEVLQYNKRCAEFLGISNGYFKSEIDCPTPEYEWMCARANCTYQIQKEDFPLLNVWDYLEFHSDWNWIKSLLEKISSLNEDDFSDETQQAFEDLLDLSLFSSKESVCESINNFIKTIK